MLPAPFSYDRPLLAEQYCDALQGAGLIDVRSGLFLAAPRRTGKSTFFARICCRHSPSEGGRACMLTFGQIKLPILAGSSLPQSNVYWRNMQGLSPNWQKTPGSKKGTFLAPSV